MILGAICIHVTGKVRDFVLPGKWSALSQKQTLGICAEYDNLHGFCWKFSALCSSERISQIGQEL